jgi:hypothetical protein
MALCVSMSQTEKILLLKEFNNSVFTFYPIQWHAKAKIIIYIETSSLRFCTLRSKDSVLKLAIQK